MLKNDENAEKISRAYTLNLDKEQIEFFDEISKKELKLGSLRSKNLKHKVEIKELNISTPVRVGKSTGSIQINLPIVKERKINSDQLFFLLVWCSIEYHLDNLKASDQIAIEYYESTGRTLSELLNIYSIMVELNNTEENRNRHDNILNLLKQISTK